MRFLALLIMLLMFASCTNNNSSERLFNQLQEDMIDRDAEFSLIYSMNQGLAYESSLLKTRLEDIKDRVEMPKYTQELPSPKNRINDDQLRITRKKVTLDLKNIYWGYMLDSNSMDPLLDAGATILTVKTEPKDIVIGDLIVFKSNFSEYNIVHRVVNISSDLSGTYFVTRGDNNPYQDPIKVRSKDIIAVVVGILY